jgi:hypothetical protein
LEYPGFHEVGSVSGASTTYDNNGNLTVDEAGKQFVYDVSNRLLDVKSAGGSSTASTCSHSSSSTRPPTAACLAETPPTVRLLKST